VQTIDTVGVKNDLVAIGQAERIYQAGRASYGSLDDLVSSGAMTLKKAPATGIPTTCSFDRHLSRDGDLPGGDHAGVHELFDRPEYGSADRAVEFVPSMAAGTACRAPTDAGFSCRVLFVKFPTLWVPAYVIPGIVEIRPSLITCS